MIFSVHEESLSQCDSNVSDDKIHSPCFGKKMDRKAQVKLIWGFSSRS